jgi:hypothetical protein
VESGVDKARRHLGRRRHHVAAWARAPSPRAPTPW